MRCGLVTFAAVALVLGLTTPAWAEPSPDSKKAFEEGRKLAEVHDYPRAIDAFERSAALDPSIGANFNLAFCYEQVKRPDDALGAYHRAQSLALKTNDARLKDVNAAIKKLLDTNEWVALKTPPDVAGAPGLQVELDGKLVPRANLDGEVIRGPAPGGHTVKVSANGHADATTPGLANRSSFTIALGPAIDAAAPGPPGPAPLAPLVNLTPPPREPEGGWGWQKWTGVGLVGAGAVSAAIGVVLFVNYRSNGDKLQADATAMCANRACRGANNPRAEALKSQATDLDHAQVRNGIITYGLAGALAVGGAVLFFTAPSSSSTSTSSARVQVIPRVGVEENGLSVVGTF